MRPYGPASPPDPLHSPRTPTCRTPTHKRVPQQHAPPFSPQGGPDNPSRRTRSSDSRPPSTCLLSLSPTRSDFFQGCPQACPGLTQCRSSSVPPILNRTATSAQPYPAELQHTLGHPWDPRMWQADMLFFQGGQLPQVRSLSCSSGPRPGTPRGEWQASF